MDDIINSSAPVGKSCKYALRECERRFLLARLPDDQPIVRTTLITDNYLIGTRLRLRRMVETTGGSTVTVYKLTQKVPAADGSPGLITTFYLSELEYDALAILAARQLRKTRHSLPSCVVDVFDPPLHGLTTAEVEFSSENALQAFAPPPFVVAELTHDIRFTGGSLVTTTRQQLRQALATYDIRVDE